MTVTIKATYELPSKKKLWLVKVTGVNRERFSGKNGLLRKYTDSRCVTFDDTYYRVKNAVNDRRYMIANRTSTTGTRSTKGSQNDKPFSTCRNSISRWSSR